MTLNAREIFTEQITRNRRGEPKGIYSVCSAHPDVLESCFKQALEDQSILLIESTSNQVDQYGGYTGMKPADFVDYVRSIARKTGFPVNDLLLGGDHLGPNVWQSLPAEEAMNRAETLIEAYVKAGYSKIHLDTSMFCADDAGDRHANLPDEIVASRAARLCKIAENTWKNNFNSKPGLIYIIGTEVPIPGGAREQEESVRPTEPEHAAATLEVTRKFFKDASLEEAWNRVTGVVVQPGVEFGDDQVFNYRREKTIRLSRKILEYDNLVYEAHSTDYQTETCLKELVEDHFCILKVGPWLTFALREALFALEAMEIEILGKDYSGLSRLSDIIEKVMIESPGYWQKYYHGNEYQVSFKRKYSFSDRLRYYWTNPEIVASKNKLFENLRDHRIPLSVLSQFMPSGFYRVCSGALTTDPLDLVHNHIRIVAGMYSRACGMSRT